MSDSLVGRILMVMFLLSALQSMKNSGGFIYFTI